MSNEISGVPQLTTDGCPAVRDPRRRPPGTDFQSAHTPAFCVYVLRASDAPNADPLGQVRSGIGAQSTSQRRRNSFVSPTTGIQLRGPERSEGLVSCNIRVGLRWVVHSANRP